MSDSYRYNLLASRMIDWDFKCNDLIPDLLQKPTEIESVNGTIKMVTIFAFLTCIIAMISSLVITSTVGKPHLDHNFKSHYKMFSIVKLIALIVLVPFMLVGMIRVLAFKSGFTSIINKGCTSQDVSDNLMNLISAMDTKTVPLYIVSLLLIILDVTVTCLLYYFMKKKFDFENFNGGTPDYEHELNSSLQNSNRTSNIQINQQPGMPRMTN